MKLSAYYKRKGEIVVLAPDFTPERNTKFFYRKDYDDGEFPPNLTKFPNVEYGGLAFSNNIYHPLPPEIEKIHPDASIYAKMEDRILGTGVADRKKIFQNMMEAEHCRLSLDGKTIWEDYPTQFRFLQTARNLMLHDYDLGQVKGSFEEVKKILARARTDGWATKVGMKFPVCISDGQSLLNWSSLNSNSTFYSLKYNGVIDDEPFNEWIGTCRQRAVYAQMDYHITSSQYDANDFVMNLLPKIFKQVIISRSYFIFFSLSYDEGFFPEPQWENVIRLFNFYHNSYANEPRARYFKKINDDTLYDFAASSEKTPKKWYGNVMSRDDIRETFAFVREKNYPLFKEFYECTARKLGGKI